MEMLQLRTPQVVVVPDESGLAQRAIGGAPASAVPTGLVSNFLVIPGTYLPGYYLPPLRAESGW